MKSVILIGYFIEAVELLENNGYKIKGYVDNEISDSRYQYLGSDEDFVKQKSLYKKYSLFLVPDNPKIRKKLYTFYHSEGFHFETVISKNAIVSKSAVISEGCMVQAGCNISSNVKLGCCVRVNSLANIMHDCAIGDFSVIAPSSVLLGKVKINDCVYIGANSTVLPGVKIESGAILGAGAVLTKDISEPSAYIGVPAKKLLK